MNKLIKFVLLGLFALAIANCSPGDNVTPNCPELMELDPESGLVGTGIEKDCNDGL